MSNVIPYQLLSNGTIKRDKDHKYSKVKDLNEIISKALDNDVEFFSFYKGQRVSTGVYTNENKKVYFMLANITFMGGKEGQHPLDLKRIQYNHRWKEFYDEYKDKGEVKWMGLYSYDDINVFGDFKPETYIMKHKNGLTTKNGNKAEYSCHIFLNDLYQGHRDNYFCKIDKGGNTVCSISFDNLKNYFIGTLKENPIITRIKQTNNSIPWNEWIKADKAITFLHSLANKYNDRPNIEYFRLNLWNGWYTEAIYSEDLIKNPSKEISYLATEKEEEIRNCFKTGLDLAFPNQKFVGDLKAMSTNSGGDSLLNDEENINRALKKYKRIWFVIYLHDTNPGKTNNYEMVKWRNKFIAKVDHKKEYNEMSAPRTPHSIKYEEMIIIELNEITKEKYFTIGRQFGPNSNGDDRKNKYKVNKRLLKRLLKRLTEEDSFVIYRESHI